MVRNGSRGPRPTEPEAWSRSCRDSLGRSRRRDVDQRSNGLANREQVSIAPARSDNLYADRHTVRAGVARHGQARNIEHGPHGIHHPVASGVETDRRFSRRRECQNHIELRTEHGIERCTATIHGVVDLADSIHGHIAVAFHLLPEIVVQLFVAFQIVGQELSLALPVCDQLLRVIQRGEIGIEGDLLDNRACA